MTRYVITQTITGSADQHGCCSNVLTVKHPTGHLSRQKYFAEPKVAYTWTRQNLAREFWRNRLRAVARAR